MGVKRTSPKWRRPENKKLQTDMLGSAHEFLRLCLLEDTRGNQEIIHMNHRITVVRTDLESGHCQQLGTPSRK